MRDPRAIRRCLRAAVCASLTLGVATPTDVAVPADVPERARDLMAAPVELVAINDFIHMARGIGNVFMISTPGGNVVFDTGVPWQAAAQRALLRESDGKAVTHVIVSHAHADHNGGIDAWKSDLDAGAELVAHERYAYMNRIYADTNEYLSRVRTRTLYPVPSDSMVTDFRSYVPTRTVDVDVDYDFEVGGVHFRAIAAQNSAEGEDALLLWLPDHGILLSGDFFGPLYPMVPNLYTVRGEKLRDPLGYVAALDRVIELEPALLLPAHFGAVRGRDYLLRSLAVIRDGTQYVYDQTVAGMNAGRSVHELMRAIELPPELAISQGHGKVSWNVRGIWELLAGWFYYEDVADLYAVPVKAVFPDLVELAGGSQTVVTRAGEWLTRGDHLKALRLLDVASASGEESETALRLRERIYAQMLEQSLDGHDNMSETGILRALLEQVRLQLGESS